MATIEQLEQRVLALEQKLTGSILDDDPYSSTHTGPEIDEATDRALPGGGIDQEMAQKEPAIESADYPGCYYRMVDGAQGANADIPPDCTVIGKGGTAGHGGGGGSCAGDLWTEFLGGWSGYNISRFGGLGGKGSKGGKGGPGGIIIYLQEG